MTEISLTRPDDMHLHLRDGEELASVVNASACRFARAVIMPNLSPPVTTTEQASAYRGRIMDALGQNTSFEPLMTIYLTDNTPPEEINRLAESEHVYAVKYYPAGSTTYADSGVTSLENVYSVLERMVELDVPLLLHGEVVDEDVDIFDREPVFIDTVLIPLMQRFPGLRMVLEHITTRQAVDLVKDGPDVLAATITAHHLLYSRNQMFKGGLRPHYYCNPVLKRERSRRALLEAALSGHTRFFLGSDSAPHPVSRKEINCGCAGIYSAPVALEAYAQIFDETGQLDQLEQFASFNGADFYGIPRNREKITLRKMDWVVPETMAFSGEKIVPLLAGEVCRWMLVEDE
jgi:dihydroorotase